MTWAGCNTLRQWLTIQVPSACKVQTFSCASLHPFHMLQPARGLIYSVGYCPTDLCDSTYSRTLCRYNPCLTARLCHTAPGSHSELSCRVDRTRGGCTQNKIYLLSMLDFIWILLCVLLYFFILSIIENPGSCPFHWWHCGRVHRRLNLEQRHL